jgi:hypothetical protein
MFYENVILTAYALLPLICLTAIYYLFIRHRCRRVTSKGSFGLIACNLLVFAMVLLGLLFAGEVYYRFIYDTTDSYGSVRTTREWFERHVKLNSVGVRDSLQIYQKRRTGQRRRVTFLGDSFTVGHGVANVEDRFANVIRRARPNCEVHTFANVGIDTSGHLGYIKQMREGGYEFDIVVLVYCLNDISDMIEPWRDHMRAAIMAPRPPAIVEHSYVINTWYYRIKNARDPFHSEYYGFVREAYRSQLWDRQIERLQLLHKVIGASGGELVVVTFPFLHSVGPDYEYREVHTDLDKFWRDSHVRHLDLLTVYEKYPAKQLVVNRYEAHPNEFAHRLAADAMLTLLDGVISGRP